MAEETETTEDEIDDDETTDTGDGDGKPGPVPYERFSAVNAKMREMEVELAKIRDDKKKADDDRLADQEKWKELAEKRQAELEAERLNRTRMEVAAEIGLPLTLAGRLQGATVEELKADAEQLAELFSKNGTIGLPARGKRKAQQSEITPEKMRDAKWVRENAEKIRAADKRGEL